jgi:aryl-alcohol dehydrogenase-like predicted oxidoreductase
MQIGDPRITEADAARLLNEVLDLEIGLIDTARSYGLSEERIGRHISGRRDDYVLSTKVGYGVHGQQDWTANCVRQGVDEARQRLKTDVIDIIHLHSCPMETLAHNGVLEALAEAREAGKVVSVAYSGDGRPLEWCIESGLANSIQCSLNICDRANLTRTSSLVAEQGIGVMAKRALAGAPWREACPGPETPEGIYRDRFRLLSELVSSVDDWAATALRFAAFRPGVHSVLCGSTNMEHVRRNVRAIDDGPLDDQTVSAMDRAYDRVGREWEAVI